MLSAPNIMDIKKRKEGNKSRRTHRFSSAKHGTMKQTGLTLLWAEPLCQQPRGGGEE